jgi:hypothetical protein
MLDSSLVTDTIETHSYAVCSVGQGREMWVRTPCILEMLITIDLSPLHRLACGHSVPYRGSADGF